MWQESEGIFRSPLLSGLPWLSHGFSSRSAPNWPGKYASLRQIHSDIALTVSGNDEAGSRQGDALLSDEAGLWVGVRTADCVPLLIVDRVLRVVAAVHAGWRGAVAEVTIKAVERMTNLYRSRPQDMVAAIGPSIAQCCYETGPEVSDQFRRWFPEAENLRFVNLPEANRRQLLSAGLPAAQIDSSGLCTACDRTHFHSWRRDRDQSGRMVAAICITEK